MYPGNRSSRSSSSSSHRNNHAQAHERSNERRNRRRRRGTGLSLGRSMGVGMGIGLLANLFGSTANSHTHHRRQHMHQHHRHHSHHHSRPSSSMGIGSAITGLVVGGLVGAAVAGAVKRNENSHTNVQNQPNNSNNNNNNNNININGDKNNNNNNNNGRDEAEPGSRRHAQQQQQSSDMYAYPAFSNASPSSHFNHGNNHNNNIIQPSAPPEVSLAEESKQNHINNGVAVAVAAPFDPTADAKQLRIALQCWDLNTIARISGSRNHSQRLLIKVAYAMIDDASNSNHDRNRELMIDLRNLKNIYQNQHKIKHMNENDANEGFEAFKQLLVALYMEEGEFDARQIFQMCSSSSSVAPVSHNNNNNNVQQSSSHHLLIQQLSELICSRTAQQMSAMKKAWTLYSITHGHDDDVNAKLHKNHKHNNKNNRTMSMQEMVEHVFIKHESAQFRHLLTSILRGNRSQFQSQPNRSDSVSLSSSYLSLHRNLIDNDIQTILICLSLLRSSSSSSSSSSNPNSNSGSSSSSSSTEAKKLEIMKLNVLDIFVLRSFVHISVLETLFNHNHNKQVQQQPMQSRSLYLTVCGLFKDDIQTLAAIQVILDVSNHNDDHRDLCSAAVSVSVSVPVFWSSRLNASLKGVRVNHDLLRSVILSRSEIDLRLICNALSHKYGNENTVRYWINDRTGGAYHNLLTALLFSFV